MQGLHPFLFKVLCKLKALRQLTETGVRHAMIRTEFHHDGDVFTCALVDGRNLLKQEGRSALNVAAILVSAGVPRGGQELVI